VKKAARNVPQKLRANTKTTQQSRAKAARQNTLNSRRGIAAAAAPQAGR